MNTLLGLSISPESVEAVELLNQGHTPGVRAIGEWKRSPDTDLAAIGDRLHSFLSANDVRTSTVNVALGPDLLFIHTFPVEPGLTRERWHQHAQWERSQFFPSVPAEEFISDVFPFPPRTSPAAQDILSVSIRRASLRALRTVIHDAGLELGSVDGAHFCAETVLLEHFPNLSEQRLLLVGAGKAAIEWSLFERKTLVRYENSRAEGAAAMAAVLGPVLTSLQPEQIVLYGLEATQDVQGAVQEITPIPVRMLDPFRTAALPAEIPLAGHFSSASFRFAAAVGAALRGAGEH